MVGPRCTLGKSCGATCIDARENCNIEFPPPVQPIITKTRDMLEKEVGQALAEARPKIKLLQNEKETIDYLANNYKQMASDGMEDNYYGAIGQRGPIRSKVWMIGQEGYTRPREVYPQSRNPLEVDKEVSKDPVRLMNINKVARELYAVARNAAPRQNVNMGLENMLFWGKDKFEFNPKGDDMSVEAWVRRNKPTTYFGALGRLLQNLGYSGPLAGGNLSSLMQPPGQQGSKAIADMLKRNGYDPKTFAEGAFANKDSWYNYSARARAPKILRAINKIKPELVYLGEQGGMDKATATNFLMYNMARQLGAVPYHYRQSFGKDAKGNDKNVDVKYMVIEHGNGKRTVIFNGPHPTGPGFRSNDKKKFVENFISSLQRTGKPPTGIVSQPVPVETMNKLIANRNDPVVANARVRRAAPAAQPAARPAPRVAAVQPSEKTARQKLNGYVQTLRNQGQSANQIKEQLQKMGIPSGLISELV